MTEVCEKCGSWGTGWCYDCKIYPGPIYIKEEAPQTNPASIKNKNKKNLSSDDLPQGPNPSIGFGATRRGTEGHE